MIILTMTTVPSRIDSALPRSLKALSSLDYDDYELHLNVPDVCKSTGEKYVLPPWLFELPKVKVFKGVEDEGPKTKIIHTLRRVTDPTQLIITVDDDVIYSRGLIKYHLNKRQPGVATGFSGTRNGRLVLTPRQDTEVDILDNYKSALYERGMFDDEFFDRYVGQSWNDDIVVSAYLRDRGVKKVVMTYDKETFFVPRVKSFPIINLIECPMTGCDIFRGHAMKNNSAELQAMYLDVA